MHTCMKQKKKMCLLIEWIANKDQYCPCYLKIIIRIDCIGQKIPIKIFSNTEISDSQQS